jgi:uncharacterized protein YuzE
MARATRTSHIVLSTLCSSFLFLAQGCQEAVVTFTGGKAHVRLFNGQTKTSAVALYADSVQRISTLQNGELSDAIAVPSGTYVLFDVRSSDDTSIRIASQRYVMADGQTYMLIVRGRTITDFFRPIVDTLQSPYPGRAAVKLINLTEETFVSVSADGNVVGMPIVDAQTVLPFTAIEPGTVRISVFDVDRNTSIGRDSTVVLEAGACYYLFVYDSTSGTELVQRWFLHKVE